jgi:hypothetical protein
MRIRDEAKGLNARTSRRETSRWLDLSLQSDPTEEGSERELRIMQPKWREDAVNICWLSRCPYPKCLCALMLRPSIIYPDQVSDLSGVMNDRIYIRRR